MRIAYIILAHNYPEQLQRLISKLNGDKVSFFIHIDKKADRTTYHQIFTQFQKFPNVFFIKRYNSGWGSFDIVRATLEGINSIVETGLDFDYVINLSGQDYLLKSNAYIKMFLQNNQGKEFLEYFPLPCSKWRGGGLRRIEYWHIRWNDKYFCIPEKQEFKSPIASLLYTFFILFLPKKRKFPEGFAIYGGSQFWCLTGECVKWINIFVKQNPNFIKRFNYTFCADELFFQTVILNSPFKDKVVNDHMRYLDWADVNAYHPRMLEKQDFEKIRQSEKLFARKFDASKNSDILDMIDKMILLSE
ncbi:glycosyl transferase [Nostoc cf. commune SO-36]|uniref:Peptide O-xylosyltransferase n=1 Tax=Nostoc cf. commune SO-36 TaxID=449208 RepID=A0ABM7YW78_NOSCO|nr:beta-1,6-N-acetylglucosaminyltransferase [Nostoc commune]BDI14878.1 glycosyl transferase [Nostoc cf. commune SO-36]